MQLCGAESLTSVWHFKELKLKVFQQFNDKDLFTICTAIKIYPFPKVGKLTKDYLCSYVQLLLVESMWVR